MIFLYEGFVEWLSEEEPGRVAQVPDEQLLKAVKKFALVVERINES